MGGKAGGGGVQRRRGGWPRGKEEGRTEEEQEEPSSFGVGQAVGGSLSGRGTIFPTPSLCTRLWTPLEFSLTNVPGLVLTLHSHLHNICPKGKDFSNQACCPHTRGLLH